MEPSGNVTLLEEGPRRIYLVGTAHISRQSVDEVARVIAQVQPEAVCIELCQARYNALVDAGRWRNLDIFKVIREGKTLFLLANLAIGAYQRRLGEQLGVRPGAEMVAAAERAKELGAEVVLVDRDINITLKRTWRNLSFGQKISLLGAVMQGLVTRQEIAAEQVEDLKQRAQLSELMREFAEAMPEAKQPLIDERDRYMISGIEQTPGETIVAVVGAGHVEGMKRSFGQPVDRSALEIIPPASRWTRALKWIIPLMLVAAFAVGYHRNQGQTLAQMVYAWILPNSLFAALLTAVAGGKLISILTALVASPITSLNPLLGAGMVVGLVEAWLRKPTVDDAERINADVQSLRGIYRNPFTRVLLVAVLASVGSALGAWIGISWVLTLLA
jgi:pheromone shutdown-related protein TraB